MKERSLPGVALGLSFRWLRRSNYLNFASKILISDLAETPRFGDPDRTLYYQGFKHIVVEINVSEARREKWRPGFYRSGVNPRDAFGRLIRNAFETALGKENIIRIEYSDTTDSRGQDALHITTVIPPNAARNLRQGATLDALVKLQERLREMREERNPIVEYATEAELAENAGH
jgi:hypothetical protein